MLGGGVVALAVAAFTVAAPDLFVALHRHVSNFVEPGCLARRFTNQYRTKQQPPWLCCRHHADLLDWCASDRLRRLHEAELAGLEAALSTVRPERTCGDIANAFYRTIEKVGFKKESRCGYAIGIDWAEPTASLQASDMTELKPYMTFHLMLGNWVDEDFRF